MMAERDRVLTEQDFIEIRKQIKLCEEHYLFIKKEIMRQVFLKIKTQK